MEGHLKLCIALLMDKKLNFIGCLKIKGKYIFYQERIISFSFKVHAGAQLGVLQGGAGAARLLSSIK